MIAEDRQLKPDASADNANERDDLIRELDEAIREFADIRRGADTGASGADLEGALEALNTLSGYDE